MPPRPEPPKGEGDKGGQDSAESKAAAACPICGKPAVQATRPFCSPRCRDVDLNRWFTGSYVVPGSENDEEE